MSGFEFEGYKDGKRFRGYIEAETEKMAVELLKKKGVIVYAIKGSVRPVRRKRFSDKEVADFMSLLLDYMLSGIPILDSLGFMMDETQDKSIVYVASFIRDRIKSGDSLSSAMSVLGLFDSSVVGMIEAGESSGRLADVLSQIVEMYSRKWDFKRRIASAMVYPSIVFAVSVAVIVFLMSFVVPRIVAIFRTAEGQLPAVTRVLIMITGFFSENLVVILLFLLIVVLLYAYMRQKESFRSVIDRMRLRLPVVGGLEKSSILYIYALTLFSLLESGILIDRALRLASGVVSNLYVRDILGKLSEGVIEGKSLSDVMRKASFFPDSVVYMVAMGEKSGNVESILKRLADRYRASVEEQIHRFIVVFEPLMILVVGGIVGFIVISILLPILSMSTLVH